MPTIIPTQIRIIALIFLFEASFGEGMLGCPISIKLSIT